MVLSAAFKVVFLASSVMQTAAAVAAGNNIWTTVGVALVAAAAISFQRWLLQHRVGPLQMHKFYRKGC